MKIIVTVADEYVRELNRKEYTSPAGRKLLKTINENAAELKPLYPNLDDAELRNYFVIDTGSPENVSGILSELWKSGAITSAYVKPSDEPPYTQKAQI
jgi:hypothetical protein